MEKPHFPDSDVKTVADLSGILRRRKWMILLPALGCLRSR